MDEVKWYQCMLNSMIIIYVYCTLVLLSATVSKSSSHPFKKACLNISTTVEKQLSTVQWEDEGLGVEVVG